MVSIKSFGAKIHSFFEKYGLFCSVALAVIGAVLYSTLSLVRHMHFQSGAFDLGIFDQTLWQYSHFLFPFNTIKMRMILGDHFTPGFALFAPLYWIWNDVRALLILQAVWIAISSVGMYLYFVKRGLSSLVSLILSQSYLYFYGVQFGIYFDFHTILLGVGFLPWILYFWESEKWKLFIVTVIIALSMQENMGLALFALSLIWFFQGKRRKLAVLLGIVGIAVSAIGFKLIPLFSNVGLEYVPHLSHQPIAYITQFFDAPEKRQVMLYTFSWYSFIPIFSPGALLATLSDLGQYFLTGPAYERMWSPFMHHRAILSVYLAVGAADVLLFLKSRKINPIFIALPMLAISVFLNYHFHFAIDKLVHRDFWQSEVWMSNNEEMITKIPPGVSLAAQQSLVPHVSHRKEIYLAYPRQHYFGGKSPCGQKQCWWLDFAGKPQYLFVDTHDNEWLTMTLESIDNFRQAIKNMENSGTITLVTQKGQAKLYRIHSDQLQKFGI